MWRLSSQKREIVLAITVGIADQRLGQQGQAPRFPRLPVLTLPQPPPRLGLSIVWNAGATADLLDLCAPRDGLALRLRREVCTPPN